MTRKNQQPEGVIHYPPGSLSRFIGPRFWPVWSGLTLLRLIIMLPLSNQLWLGRRLGEILFYVLPRRRFFAARNLELCFPEFDKARHSQILKDSFRNVGMSVFETAMAWWASDRRMQDIYEIEGLDEVAKGLAEGHGRHEETTLS